MRDMQDMKVWDREVWAPEDYDAIYKIAQSPTLLHFTPFLPNRKNISKKYQTSKPPIRYPKSAFQTLFARVFNHLAGCIWGYLPMGI
jgi:hypothetical protein